MKMHRIKGPQLFDTEILTQFLLSLQLSRNDKIMMKHKDFLPRRALKTLAYLPFIFPKRPRNLR